MFANFKVQSINVRKIKYFIQNRQFSIIEFKRILTHLALDF